MMLPLVEVNYEGALAVCNRLPMEERALFARITGEPYVPAQAAANAENLPGFKWLVLDHEYIPIALGGFIRQRPGVFQTFFYGTDDLWVRNGADATRTVRHMIDSVLAGGFAHRVETITLADQSRARTWYEKIGLTYEATLRGFAADRSDAVMYVALRDPETN